MRRIKTKMGVAFGILFVQLLILVVIILAIFYRSDRYQKQIVVREENVEMLRKLRHYTVDLVMSLSELSKNASPYYAVRDECRSLYATLTTMPWHREEEIALVRSFGNDLERVIRLLNEMFEKGFSDEKQKHVLYDQHINSIFTDAHSLVEQIDKLHACVHEDIHHFYAYSESAKRTVFGIVLGSSVLSMLFIAVMLRYIQQRIIDPLVALRDTAKAVSQGNLSHKLSFESDDEIGELTQTFNSMVDDLHRITTLLYDAKSKAEEATQAQSRFLANVSHEIRTPINAVIGFSNLLSQSFLDELQKDYVKTIMDSAEVLNAIINDILDVSNMEYGQFSLACIPFDLRHVIENVVKVMSLKVQEKEIALVCNVDSDLDGLFVGDPVRVRQVVFNVVSNAVKFTEKGKIVISVKRDTTLHYAPTQKGKHFITIGVKDTGIGIPDDQYQNIFALFQQLDSSETKKYGGIGLGLTITQRVVALMGGEISIISQEGEGSEFIMTIPLKPFEKHTGTNVSCLLPPELVEKQVLILDNNEHSRALLDKYCSDEGMPVALVTGSVWEAFEWLEKASTLPAFLICDLMIPNIGGYAFARKLRRDVRFNKMRLIAITSDLRPGLAHDVFAAGFDALLEKPVLRNELFEVMACALKGGSRKKLITSYTVNEEQLEGVRVLLVENNPINSRFVSVLLNRYGCRYTLVRRASDAIDLLGKKKYDIIIVDLCLPDMHGSELICTIRRNVDANLPIVAVGEMVKKTESCGVADLNVSVYLTKPLNSAMLKKALSDCMRIKAGFVAS